MTYSKHLAQCWAYPKLWRYEPSLLSAPLNKSDMDPY